MTTSDTKPEQRDAKASRRLKRDIHGPKPRSVKPYLFSIGRPAIYASKDMKWIITEYPDGRVKKKRLVEQPLIEPLPDDLVTPSGKPSRRA